MPLTHMQVISEAENKLMKALISGNLKEFKSLVHPDIVFTDESGQTHLGMAKIPYLNPSIITLETCEVVERTISFFTNVAVVNAVEKRSGKYRGIHFENEFRIMHTWKFSGRHWQVISASLVPLPEKEPE